MAHSSTQGPYSLPAAADYSAIVNGVPTHQYKFVVINTSGQIALAGLGVRADGILENLPKANDMARYGYDEGVRKIKLGGTVAIGDQLTPNASGLAIKAVTAGHYQHGKALRAGVSGDVIEMQFDRNIAVP